MKLHFLYLLGLFVLGLSVLGCNGKVTDTRRKAMSSSSNANAHYAEGERCEGSKYAVGDYLPNDKVVVAEWSIWNSGTALGVIYQAGYANERYVVAFHSMPARMRQQLRLKRLVTLSDQGSVEPLRALPHGVELKNC